MNESELLLSGILKCGRMSLYLDKSRRLDKTQSALLCEALKRRAGHEPVQYILGESEFMGIEFKVSPDVLIPRPETEILVENVISLLSSGITVPRILEIGTGSGCIAVSLAKFLPEAEITATDISESALGLAGENAHANKVEDRIKFLKGDLFEPLTVSDTRYTMCVSNPPYIASSQIDGLAPEIKYEPRMALDGGEDGLDFYRRIIPGSLEYLEDGGYLALEMGFGQATAIEGVFKKSGGFMAREVIKDYAGIERVIIAQKF